jgi:tetratricopeptide (TPR) repeat protein
VALGYVGPTTTSLARLNLGEILYRGGKLPEAERELRSVVESQPTNVPALLWLAKTVRDQGRAKEALALYEHPRRAGDNWDAHRAVDLAAGRPSRGRPRLADGPGSPRRVPRRPLGGPAIAERARADAEAANANCGGARRGAHASFPH